MPVRRVAIRIYSLSQELNLRVADVRKLAHFSQDGIARAIAFRSARVWHYAIRARLIAALNDCEIGPKRVVTPRQLRLKRFIRIGLESRHAVLARFQTRQQQWQLAITRGPAHEAYPRSAFENLFAFLLRHAAEHANHFAGFASEIISGVEQAEPGENFVRGLFADTARIVENQPRLAGRSDLPIPAPQQHARHLLRIVLVHLAAEGLEIKRAAVLQIADRGRR